MRLKSLIFNKKRKVNFLEILLYAITKLHSSLKNESISASLLCRYNDFKLCTAITFRTNKSLTVNSPF